jgi:hypothetical protein
MSKAAFWAAADDLKKHNYSGFERQVHPASRRARLSAPGPMSY